MHAYIAVQFMMIRNIIYPCSALLQKVLNRSGEYHFMGLHRHTLHKSAFGIEEENLYSM